MKNLNKTIYILFIVSLLISCSPKRGTITIVNTTLDSVNITFDGKNIVLAPEQHFTRKGMKTGQYMVKIGATTPEIKLNIKGGRTTIVDVGGENCFVVANYSDQYGKKAEGDIKIVEKYVNKTTFTTQHKITSELGEQLPETAYSKPVTRIHRVDCSWIDNNQAIVDAIANLP